MMKKAALAFSLLLAFSPVARAQFSETVEVRVTNVEAIVTDRDGKPVAGLTKDDFVVYENGVKQDLTNFTEVHENVPSAVLTQMPQGSPESVTRDPRPRVVTVFVDNTTIDLPSRAAVLPALQRFLYENVRPGDAVSIYTWGGNLKMELEPTSDAAAIDAAVARIGRQALFAGANWRPEFERDIANLIELFQERSTPVPEKPPISMAINTAATYAARNTAAMRQKIEAMKSVLASLRGVDARKVLVLLTESLESNPAEQAFLFIDALRDEFAGTFSPLSEARIYELPELATEVATAANASGVTLYPINTAGKFTDSRHRDPSLNAQLTYRPVIETQTSTINMHAVATSTGGVATAGSSNWKLAFDTISNDLNVYYSLGYRTSGERKDRVKNVEVRLANKNHRVRTRKAIVERTAASEMSDSVSANLFHDPSVNDLGIEAEAERAASTSGDPNVVIPVTVRIPTETLTLIPDGDDLAGSFSVFAAFLRQDGAVSRVAKQTHQFRFPADSLGRRKEVTVKLDVTADPRTGSISLGVMDEASRVTGFTVVKLN